MKRMRILLLPVGMTVEMIALFIGIALALTVPNSIATKYVHRCIQFFPDLYWYLGEKP